MRWQDLDAAARLAKRIWAIADLGTLVRVDRDLGDQIAELKVQLGLSSHGAGYVAAARRLGTPLASCDERDLVQPGLAQLPSSLIKHWTKPSHAPSVLAHVTSAY